MKPKEQKIGTNSRRGAPSKDFPSAKASLSGNGTRDLGRRGECVAQSYLENKGFQILARNWRDGHREIDLIALDKAILVFVEVKTRRGAHSERPELAVDRIKQKNIARAAAAWLLAHTGKLPAFEEIRYDVLAIRLVGEQFRVLHLPDAFFPGG